MPGAVPDWTWIEETRRFIEQAELRRRTDARAAAFRRTSEADTLGSAIVEALGLIAATLGAPPRPQQGLLLAKTLYEQLGGHRGEDADPEGELLRRSAAWAAARHRFHAARIPATMMAGRVDTSGEGQ